MKKHSRKKVKSVPTRGSRVPQTRTRGGLFWVFVAAFCFVAFIGVFGFASMSQDSQASSVTSKQKSALLQPHRQAQPQSVQQNPIPAFQPAPTRQAGIVDMQQGPFLSSVFVVRNFWQGPVNRDWLLVYAGFKPNADGSVGSGGIMLYNEVVNAQGGFDLRPVGQFLAPKGTSGLTIISANDLLLQLHTDTGSTLTFDLQTHKFH